MVSPPLTASPIISFAQLRMICRRTERLEKRIEELAAQLAAQKHDIAQASRSAPELSPASNPVGLSTPPISEDVESSILDQAPSSIEAFEVFWPRYRQKGEGDVVDRGLLNAARAEGLVEKFKTLKMPSFPFVVIPAGKTATALREESPFLFLAIITACLEDDTILQRRIADEVRSAISTRIIMANEKSLELLQGLLVYLAWYYYHFAPKRHQMYLMLNLARALVFDLCLDKSPNTNAQELGILMEIKARLSEEHKVDVCDDVANGRRAVLGYYYLSSALCICRRGLAMKYTPWIDECCRSLKEWAQYPTDTLIEPLVRTRTLHQNICDTLLENGDSACQSDSVLEMAQSAFQKELETLQAGFPVLSGLEKYVLETECMTAATAIHEVALFRSCSANVASFSRTKSLSSLLKSSRNLVNLCLRIPDNLATHLSIASVSIFWYGFMVLAKVVLIPTSPGWDQDRAKNDGDLAGLGRIAKDKLTSIRSTQKQDVGQIDVWTFFCHIMRSMLIWNKKHVQHDKEDPITEGLRNASDAVARVTDPPCPLNQPIGQNTTEDPAVDACETEAPKLAAMQPSPDISQESWDLSPSEFLDDSLWQRVLDDFTLLPPAPLGGYANGAFAPYGYPLSGFAGT
ncbi:MAG: hypothetical protein M1821_006344 [Bathelium mastoideum]|nr:MAG: hypothetical protein M1821_006344 [Bathelium mastoideum]KAI9693622.1 MAG: hypothetical protein M1822_002893 [Bathelium mastoideum]